MRTRIFSFIVILVIILLGGTMLFQYAPNQNAGYGCSGCNIIMIDLSNVSAENMGLYGYNRNTTPFLEEFAKDALVFDDFFAPTSWTLPNATSLFTSLYPYTHNVLNRYPYNVLSENIKTFPEVLGENGYKTFAIVGGLDYSARFGHMRGFDDVVEQREIDLTERDGVRAVFDRTFADTFKTALSWIKKADGEKFFLFLHGYDAHCPFVPPPETEGVWSDKNNTSITVDNSICYRGFRNEETGTYKASYYLPRSGRFSQEKGVKEELVKEIEFTERDIAYLRDLYDEEVFSLDKLLESFIGGLDKRTLNNTVIIIFSDHGEMFAKHGRFGRAGSVRGTLYDDVMHVPLIIKVPGAPGKRVFGITQFIDVVPTLMEMLEIKPKDMRMQGKSALPLITRGEKINEYAYSGSLYGSKRNLFYDKVSVNESIRDEKWKLIREGILDINTGALLEEEAEIVEQTFELYDLVNDPEEFNNVAEENPEVFERLKARLEEWAVSSRTFLNETPGTEELPEEFIEEARKRGYW
ncbi:MAG: hypothetical protein BMS9Abin13_308 [Patescibacteria group bacterium]|nr:MAG: hypothetical protein BMS9Abin13_308 [Patescibacteria group bacterium]